jgi:hypothetical protein
MEFASESVKVARMKEDADYEGVRVHFRAVLARARIPMQVDIGFGDVVNPGVIEIEYPTLLGFSAPVLRAYPKETVVAEKQIARKALPRPQAGPHASEVLEYVASLPTR